MPLAPSLSHRVIFAHAGFIVKRYRCKSARGLTHTRYPTHIDSIRLSPKNAKVTMHQVNMDRFKEDTTSLPLTNMYTRRLCLYFL